MKQKSINEKKVQIPGGIISQRIALHTIKQLPLNQAGKSQVFSYLLAHLNTAINLFDHQTKKFLFVNDKFKELVGVSEDECYTQELEDYGSWINEEDLYILEKQIGKRLREIYNEYTLDRSEQLTYFVNFRLKEKAQNKEQVFVLAQCTVVEWTEERLPAITLNVLTDITHYRHNQKMILTVNQVDKLTQQWKTILKEEFLRVPQKLGKREKEIMSEMLKDKSATEISKEKKMSFFTVRSHWRNILQKTNCKTQKEFKHLAQTEGWS